MPSKYQAFLLRQEGNCTKIILNKSSKFDSSRLSLSCYSFSYEYWNKIRNESFGIATDLTSSDVLLGDEM